MIIQAILGYRLLKLTVEKSESDSEVLDLYMDFGNDDDIITIQTAIPLNHENLPYKLINRQVTACLIRLDGSTELHFCKDRINIQQWVDNLDNEEIQ